MPSAVAEGRTAAMGTAARSWRLITRLSAPEKFGVCRTKHHPCGGALYAAPRRMRRAVAPGRKSLQSRPPESLTKPGAYPGRGIYAVPRCGRWGRKA
nr:MAG TPA: hypothetical protein [Caudoviricetes sp.]